MPAEPSHTVSGPTGLIVGVAGIAVTVTGETTDDKVKLQRVVGLVATTFKLVTPVVRAFVIISRFDPVPPVTRLTGLFD